MTARPSCRRPGQKGFTIVSAIFILVVLTALAAAAVNFFTTQQVGFANDLLGTRAYLAARAGIEWGVYRLNSSNGFAGTAAGLLDSRTCPAAGSFVPPAPTLSAFTVTVTCAASAPAAGCAATSSCAPTVFQIDAVACNAPVSNACPGVPGTNYVERRIRVTL